MQGFVSREVSDATARRRKPQGKGVCKYKRDEPSIDRIPANASAMMATG
jgi:hypothetical protein